MKFHKQKGFTLIELLVVIAIIAILIVIVLASISNAKKRAVNTKIMAEMREMMKQAELYALQNGSYGVPQPHTIGETFWGYRNHVTYRNSIFFNTNDPNSLYKYIERIRQLSGTPWAISGVSTGQAWAFTAWLPNHQEVYCIDSMGTLKAQGVAPWGPTNPTNYLNAAHHRTKAYCCVNPSLHCSNQ